MWFVPFARRHRETCSGNMSSDLTAKTTSEATKHNRDWPNNNRNVTTREYVPLYKGVQTKKKSLHHMKESKVKFNFVGVKSVS